MADGTVLDNIEGVVIPLTNDTLPAYRLLAEYRIKSLIETETKDFSPKLI